MPSQNSSSSSSSSPSFNSPTTGNGEVDGHPPSVMPILARRDRAPRTNWMQLELMRIQTVRRLRARVPQRAAPAAGAGVQPEASPQATRPRSPTQHHVAALQYPVFLRALPRINQEEHMSLRNQSYGGNARGPARNQQLRIGAAIGSDRNTTCGSALRLPTSNAAPPTSNETREIVGGARAAAAPAVPVVATVGQRGPGVSIYRVPGETHVSITCICGHRFYNLDEFYSHALG